MENVALSYATMVTVALVTEDGETSVAGGGSYGFPGYHAVWGDRCLRIDGRTFMDAAARLVGLRIVGELPTYDQRGLLDFDAAERRQADTSVGMDVQAMSLPDCQPLDGRSVTLSIGEFWDFLEGIAEGRP